MRTTDNKRFACSFWSDIVRLKSAQAIATFEQDYYAGSAAVTRSRFGKGTAFYVGTLPDANGRAWLLKEVCETAGIKPIVSRAPRGVEVLKRVNGDSSWLFVLNYSSKKVTVPLETNGHDLLTGAEVKGDIELAPSGVAIIQV